MLGASGLVGRALTAELSGRSVEHLALTKADLDIGDRDAVVAAVAGFAPELIYNCAAYSKVDDCEAEMDQAQRVNADGVAHLAEAARACGGRLVHISTDYVFDGRATSPYREDAATAPATRYGTTKLDGEKAALSNPDSLVVRTSWVFGSTGPSFVQTVLCLLGGEAPVGIVEDQIGGPTYAPYLSRALVDLAEVGARGIVHYQNREAVSWFGFAQAIAARIGSERSIAALTTAEFPRPAPRPAYSVLCVARFEELMARTVESWSDGLEDCLLQLGVLESELS